MEDLGPGSVLGERYVLQGLAGEGGMAAVWQATDQVLDRPVAVKILHARLAEEPSFLERFRAEALTSARLTHPNIVNVFDTGNEDHTAFIVMELFDGETLRDRLNREGHLEPDDAVEIMLQVLSALQFAHENGLIHRDVKPANILVGADGRVKVTDFGIAKAAYDTGDPTTTGSVLGSVPYMAPEQVEGTGLDARSDVYACGATLYEMLTGRPPFEAETTLAAAMMRLTRDPVPPRAVRTGIPRALDAIVMRALAREPDRRFASAEDMATALSRLQVGGGPTPRPRTAAPTHAPAGRSGAFRSWMLVPLLAILLAAAAIGVGLLIGTLQFGGPLGIQQKKASPSGANGGNGGGGALKAAEVMVFDPLGDDHENDQAVPAVTDGDPSTFWETENYRQLDFGGIKPGLGLLFDLGKRATVTGFKLLTPHPGFHFEIRVGNDPAALQDDAGPSFTAKSSMRPSIPPAEGRYVLLWMTDVVPIGDGSNRDTVAEFKVLGSGG
jgi:eukaryotic-like serine/threonine-protein kinase